MNSLLPSSLTAHAGALPSSAAATVAPRTAQWSRAVLIAAAAWNIVGGISALLDPAKQFAQLFHTALPLDEPLALFFYRCTWINVIAWGLAYLFAAFLPGARLPALAAGAVGKIFYFAAGWAVFAAGAAQPALVLTGVVDLVFAALFVLVLLKADTTHRA